MNAALLRAGYRQGARAHPVDLDALERRMADVEGVAGPLGHGLAHPARVVVPSPERRELAERRR
jgi:hypothetical protein